MNKLRKIISYIDYNDKDVFKKVVAMTKEVLNEDFLKKYGNFIGWTNLSRNSYLTEQLVETFFHQFDIDLVMTRKKFTMDFLEKYFDLINKSTMVMTQSLSKEFIEKYESKLDWKMISFYQKYDEDFVTKYFDKMSVITILKKTNISNDYIINNFEKFPKDEILSERKYLPETFLKEHYFEERYIKNILLYQKVSETFIMELNEKIRPLNSNEWYTIQIKQQLSMTFIENNMDKFDLYTIPITQTLNNHFIVKYKDILVWENLCKYQTLTQELFDTIYTKIKENNKLIKYIFKNEKIDLNLKLSLKKKMKEDKIYNKNNWKNTENI